MKNQLLNRPVKIGQLVVPSNLFLAPMAGYTDKPYRRIVSEQGRYLLFTEMISSEAVCRDNGKTFRIADPVANHLNGIQLFGADPLRCADAAIKLLPFSPALFDLNCGCPVSKVIKTGAGAALLKDPEIIYSIIKAITEALRSEGQEIPVTIKIRSGWDNNSLNYFEVVKAAEEGGAAMVSIHARTRAKGYSGSADWNIIKQIVSFSSLPICGSGDLFKPIDALKMLYQTSCVAVMFARGAIGNPWIFSQTENILNLFTELSETERDKVFSSQEALDEWESSISSSVTVQTILETAWRHLKFAIDFLDEQAAAKEIRKHLCGYTKGLQNGKAFRNDLVRCKSFSEYQSVFKSYDSGLDFQ